MFSCQIFLKGIKEMCIIFIVLIYRAIRNINNIFIFLNDHFLWLYIIDHIFPRTI